ncbi:anthrone oxygenase family protein [Actinoplanes derwentensis]|uniref:Uncharacterized membrane protein n=1 Tax=Actinoplanes derwentensis TaxID=113562 RepID=A0A1H1RBB2_9ACTN|nr:anthrone oxygenase family protein [Actinoplanes derwentensis]GID88063.1 membrane protein [Actinoplanes derwentensis]SDS32980.1 Uncharacterized membrane protein [Actinoplanes derwentensis]
MSYPPYARPHPAVPPQAGPSPAKPAGSRPVTVTLIAGLICMGLMAGLFFGFTVSVMPGLAAGDDLTFVTAMQNINDKIENGLFGLVFTGAFAFPVIAAVQLLRRRRWAAAIWTAAAAFAYLLVLGLTMAVEIPLNETLAAAGDPSRIADPARVRHDFATVWVPVNDLRTVLNLAGLALLAPALYLHGKTSAGAPGRG